MAGEPIIYDAISSTKLVNKEGLLELSNNIKAYVAENAGGSSDEVIWVELDSISNVYNEDFATNRTYLDQRILDFISNYRTETYYEDSLFSKKVRCKNGNNIMFYIEFVPIGGTYKQVGLICNHMSWSGNLTGNVRQTYYGYTRSIGSNHFITWYNLSLGYPGADLPALPSNVMSALNTDTVGCLEVYQSSRYSDPVVRWRTIADFKTDLNIPSIPASSSTDGTYMLVDTVSNGTSTKSWETVPSGGGGGATYTAGTGISIDANGVISLALANASEEAM